MQKYSIHLFNQLYNTWSQPMSEVYFHFSACRCLFQMDKIALNHFIVKSLSELKSSDKEKLAVYGKKLYSTFLFSDLFIFSTESGKAKRSGCC